MKKLDQFSNISDDYFRNVVLAAPLHDIGKIKIPDVILNKPAKLTDKEYEVIKKHSEYGAVIVKKTIYSLENKEYADVAYNIAKYHHERWDGTGYPERLKGEEIPLEARIMALADVYDALISDRVYKKAYTKEVAIKIIEEGSGTQFDPLLASLFVECIKQDMQ
jgi:HD-GYP domain-containing protein (c-di-GMP phosphodiesterase class II)